MEKKYIRLTKNKIKEIFEECNQKYFNNQIKTPEIFDTWTPTIKCVGWVRAVWDKRNHRNKVALHISSKYNWTEENLRNVILHEMIHLDIKDYLKPLNFWQRLFRLDHDKRFHKRMKELNKEFNLNILPRAKFMRTEIKKSDK